MKKTLNLAGEILDLSTPKIMGILNATPDSFFAKSRVKVGFEKVIDQMVTEGVDILDVGGYSTRPGADDVSIQEEIDRVLPIISYIEKTHPAIPISIDSFRHQVIKEAIKVRHVIVNDVSGGALDPEMWSFVAREKLAYILMHMRGKPSTMQLDENTGYSDVIEDVIRELQLKIKKLNDIGVIDLVVDPGIGFAKKRLDNFRIIESLSVFNILDNPILIGLSRKSFMWKTLECSPEDTLPATCAMHSLALQFGAKILRVHDVAEAVQVRNVMLKGMLL